MLCFSFELLVRGGRPGQRLSAVVLVDDMGRVVLDQSLGSEVRTVTVVVRRRVVL
jgi:hypothetical protein